MATVKKSCKRQVFSQSRGATCCGLVPTEIKPRDLKSIKKTSRKTRFGAGGSGSEPARQKLPRGRRVKKSCQWQVFSQSRGATCCGLVPTGIKSRDLKSIKKTSRKTRFGAGGRTRTGTVLLPRDFKSLASTIPPHQQNFGGTSQTRTGDKGFADPGLTTWRRYQS